MASHGTGGNAWDSMGSQLATVAETIRESLQSNKSSWTGTAADQAWQTIDDIITASLDGSNLFLAIGNNIQEVAGMQNYLNALAQESEDLYKQILSKIKLATVPLTS